jgi:hypothetical protein
MPEERISMSQSERERLKVLQGIEQGYWTRLRGTGFEAPSGYLSINRRRWSKRACSPARTYSYA